MDEQLPATCQLDRNRLSSIETKLDLALTRLDNLVSIDGPIGQLQKDIILNRQMTEVAHKRIDEHDHALEGLGVRQWEIVWKSAGLVGGGGVVGYIAIQLIERLVG